MILEKTFVIDGENEDFTGYSISLPSSSVTGCGEISVLQGSRIKFHNTPSEELFPDSREEKFMGNKLVEFYKKKGYRVD